jgi:20S proteasome alpha/beta subunit
VTVCLACVCMWPDGTLGIVGASDRMITVGDVQFEPYFTKIFPLTSSIFALTSGESSVNGEIIAGALGDVSTELAKSPTTWMPVETAARIIGRQVQAYNMRLGDLEILAPLGLTRQSFLQQSKTHWFQDMFDKLFAVDSGSDIIVAGLDDTGAHIWKIDGKGKPWLHDPAAFAAIGSGQRHAESQFQFGRHGRDMPFSQALFLAYKAKRRSEVAPGVGRIFTDMVLVPSVGNLTWLQFQDITFLDGLYRSQEQQEWELARSQELEINMKFQQLFDAAAAAGASAADQQNPSDPPQEIIDVKPEPDGS